MAGHDANGFEVRVAAPHPLLGRFAELNADRYAPHRVFAELLESDPRMTRRVLEVGCGGDLPAIDRVGAVLRACERHDGVEPDPAVEDHPHLAERWCALFEDAPVPAETYDALLAFWVVEHIEAAVPFLKKAYDVLKPGGVVYAYTPHALHPFAAITRAIQTLGLKGGWRRAAAHKINDYPAYYRMNRVKSVARAARAAGFARADFHLVPCMQWDHYFPRPLRFVPHLYDRMIGIRYRGAGLIFIFRLEKAAT
jgi:SAM-dependent methyltransferase